MLRQLTTFLLFVMVLASGCSKRGPGCFIDTVHGYLRCNKDLRDIDRAMLEIRREYGFQHLRTENQSTDAIQYNTTSYLVPGDKELTLEAVAEKGQPTHIKFKMDAGGLYSREEIVIELARRIDVLPNAKALKVKKPLENNKSEEENIL